MKRMLINATHSEEIRVALADGQKLYNLDIDIPGQERKKGNIYKGKITRVEPSLEAAFVEYGSNRHGFLPYKEISRNYYTDAANKMKERPPISVAVKEGTEVIIQVNKEERGNKGAAISTYISLAGRYLVYMPENPKAGGISRRIEGKARQELKSVLSKVTQPKNAGVIVRTAGIGRTAEELEWDINYLDQVWTAIKTVAATRKAPFFIYQESDIFIRALRDYLRPDVGEILIDNKEIYEKARDFMQQVMPHNLKKLSYYNDSTPLFSRYQIEGQIQSAFSREVRLPSGGSIVIDHTEAMISIDVNSARATKGADIEETATNTNLEAADEVARQLRIRDIGGLVVIDFIDMRNHKNQRSVELQLDEAVSNDRARIQTSKISRFGLLEMSRQRLRSSINDVSQLPCPRCSGHGFIRNIESLSVSILRIMEEEVQKPGTGKVVAQVPTKVANFITNEKRQEMADLESRHKIPMLVVANEFFQTPQFDIERLKKSEANSVDINNIVLKKPENEEEAEKNSNQALHQQRQVPAVDVLVPQSQIPTRKQEGGVIDWLKSLFTSNSQPAKKKTEAKSKPQPNRKNNTTRKPSQNNQNKKPQHNNQNRNKPQTNKQPNKKPQHNNQNKKPAANNTQQPQNKKPQHSNQQAKNPQTQNKKPAVKKQQPQKQNVAQNAQQKNTNVVIEETKPKEQILQRPLGSVASYAANKSKQTQNNDSSKVETKPENVIDGNQAPKKKPQTAKTTANTAEVKNVQTDAFKIDQQSKVENTSPAKSVDKDKVKANDSTVAKKPAARAKAPAKKAVAAKAKPVTHAEKELTNEAVKIDKPMTKRKPATKAKEDTKEKVIDTKAKVEEKSATPVKENPPKAQAPEKAKAAPKTKAVPNKAPTKTEPKKGAKTPVNKTEKAPAKAVVKKTAAKKTESPKAEAKPVAKKTEAPKAETKPVAEKTEAPKVEVKPVAEKTEAPKVEVKPVPAIKPKPKKKMPDPTSGIDFDI